MCEMLWNALHVSGGSSAHQEPKTVYTASGILSNFYCYLPLSWKGWNSSSSSTIVAGSSNGSTKYSMLYIQFWAPDDGRSYRLKHVENFIEKKIYNIASCWLYLKLSQCNLNRISKSLSPKFRSNVTANSYNMSVSVKHINYYVNKIISWQHVSILCLWFRASL